MKKTSIFLITFLAAAISALAVINVFHSRHIQNSAERMAAEARDLYNKCLVDTAVSLLKSGYIVLRTGRGADSYLLAQMNQKDKTYSHCGIVMIEHGYPFVYHSIGGEDNPDERLRRDSACFFFSPLHNEGLAIVKYDYDENKVNALRQVVGQYYKERPKFDMKFDLKTDDKLYCAEFVYKAVNKAMHDPAYIQTTSVMGCTFVGTDNLFVNAHAHIIWKTKFK
jgi:hypothetical protein